MKIRIPLLGRFATLAAAYTVIGSVGCHPSTSRREVNQFEPTMLAASWPEVSPNAYTLVKAPKTVGRFPCNLAVARVTTGWIDGSQESDRVLKLDPLSDIHAVPWMELSDTYPALTGVIVLGRPAVKFEEVTIAELLAAARRQNLSLCLIYGQTDVSIDEMRMTGALYDCSNNQVVARIDAQVTPDPGVGRRLDRPKNDQRYKDPRHVTARKFQDLVLRCIDELSRNDTPATTTQPNPWDRPGVFPMLSPWTSRGPGW